MDVTTTGDGDAVEEGDDEHGRPDDDHGITTVTAWETRATRGPPATTAMTSWTTVTDLRPCARRGGGVRLMAAAALLAAAAVVAGCGGDAQDPYLAALRADPLASYEPPGGDLDVSTEQARKDPSGTSKGQQAQILRTFRIDGPAAIAAAMDDAIAQAEGDGWNLDSHTEQGAVLSRPGPMSSTMRLTVAASTTAPAFVALTMTAG